MTKISWKSWKSMGNQWKNHGKRCYGTPQPSPPDRQARLPAPSDIEIIEIHVPMDVLDGIRGVGVEVLPRGPRLPGKKKSKPEEKLDNVTFPYSNTIYDTFLWHTFMTQYRSHWHTPMTHFYDTFLWHKRQKKCVIKRLRPGLVNTPLPSPICSGVQFNKREYY